MVGCAYLWGFGANGQAGVENWLDILRSGFDATPFMAVGHSSTSGISPRDTFIRTSRRAGRPMSGDLLGLLV
jgi:pre-mycofactocin synthase